MGDFVQQTLKAARESMRSGDLERAGGLYRKILLRDPAHAESLASLGRIALQSGRDGDAIPLIRRVLERNPAATECHADLAVALQNLGRNEEAAAAARQALSLQPANLSALNTLGNALRGQGRPDEAVDCFMSAVALDPGIAAVHLNLASALRDAGRADQALDSYRQAVALAPGNAEALFLMGTLLRGLHHYEQAAESLYRAIEIRPTYAEAHNAVGNLFVDLGERDAAETSYRRALELRPAYVEALYNLGNLLRSARRLDEAREAFTGVLALKPDLADAHVRLAQTCADLGLADRALEHFERAAALRPDHPEAHCGVGNALRALGRLDEAVAAYRQAVEAGPEFADAHCNLSTARLDQGMLDEAIDHSRRAIAAQPDLAEAYWNIGQALLTRGDLLEGWRKYDYRLLKRNAMELPFPYPVWDGSPLADRTIFVSAEQGVGDEIMFASCLADVVRAAAGCVVECDARLVPLFARSFPRAQAIARLKAPGDYPGHLPAPDCRIATGSLPMHFRNDPGDFPRPISYLVPDPAQVEAWRRRYDALGGGLKVGISWRGGKEALVRRARSIPLPEWAGLTAVSGIHLINLQYGDTREELEAARRDSGLIVHDWEDSDPLADLDGFAAQVAALDLVISVDNATVHLAGAVGTPTWVLLPSVADWRWMRDREDSPWYPALRLFRQPGPGAWNAVFEHILEALRTRVAGGGARAEDERSPAPGAPRPAGRERREWVALLNDTSYWYHWGCTGTSTAIVRTLTGRGYAVNRIPISGLHGCTQGPTTIEEFDDPACFVRFVRANPWLFRELEVVDHVVINGEGSIHGLNAYVLNLLYLAYAAKVHLGRDVQIINHSCYPESAPDDADSPVWQLYRKVYRAVDYVAVREPVSLGLLARAGIPAVQAFDCLPLTIAANPVPARVRRREGIVLAGSVALRESDVGALVTFVERMARKGTAARILVGANMFPAADERQFVRLMERHVSGALEVVDANSMALWLDTIAGAAVVVSGRFHHTIAAAALDTPFVLLESNTPKNAGLAEMLHSPTPVALDSPSLADELESRADEALRRAEAGGTMIAELCGHGMKNFLELPGAGGTAERRSTALR